MDKISYLIGNRIKNLRRAQKLSQEKLAEKSGLHTTYVGQIERGEKSPTVDSVYKISLGLEVSMDELFKNMANETQNSVYADKIYDLALSISVEKQKELYNIIEKILQI